MPERPLPAGFDAHDRLTATNPEGRVVIEAVWRARTRAAARTGLLGRDTLPAGQALALSTCSVHMLGMRFALDLVWLDRRGRVLRVDAHVQPGLRQRLCVRARTCLELAAGQADQLGLTPGLTLTLA